MRPLEGQSALVTGGSRGIGAAVAVRLARDGARVAVCYHSNRDAAKAVVERIVQAGGDAFAERLDLGSGPIKSLALEAIG